MYCHDCTAVNPATVPARSLGTDKCDVIVRAGDPKMKTTLALLLCILVPMAVFSGDNGYKVTYDGGSLPDMKSGTGMKLFIEANQIRLVRDKADVIVIPASAVTEISYGQAFTGVSEPR